MCLARVESGGLVVGPQFVTVALRWDPVTRPSIRCTFTGSRWRVSCAGEERHATGTPALARFSRPPAVGDRRSCLGRCATQVRPRGGAALPGGVKGKGIPQHRLAGGGPRSVVRRHRRGRPRPSPRSATPGCPESQDPPGYSVVALEGVKRRCQADPCSFTGSRVFAGQRHSLHKETEAGSGFPGHVSWSPFHTLSPRMLLGLVAGSSRNTGRRAQYGADGLWAPGPMPPAACADERGAVQLEALPSACWVLVRT
ncbi:uncharacterized protein [Physeter macrocephalus]|uniref:Uncharacterized protein isoform X1 n=1 Tax=Physeter macrocephalus TaxID=9755 RepID=A0A455CAI1_PHYMC|nr:uncharacterized protein LOC114487651 isoform X1 [Physeter catodon]|eukprot:XP_028354721.1 uncharacterized protein LOC114487651 [Physeter catodon]